MKRTCALLLALMLVLTGCADKGETKDVFVKDVCCPYEISHKENMVQITLQDGGQSGVLWSVENVPEGICHVSEETVDQEHTHQYRLSGETEGVTQLTFTAQREDGTVVFDLDLMVKVDAAGKVEVTSCEHRERADNRVEQDGLNYAWSVDVDGTLNFSFKNQEDKWSASAEENEVFSFSNMLATASGCQFSAQANGVGKAVVVLTGETTGRIIHVVVEAAENGQKEVVSVQEQ